MSVKFGLKPSDNPLHAGWMGRKQAVDFTGTTLATWRRVIPECYYKIKGGSEKDPKHILIMDRIAIDFGGLDRSENINKFNSAEYAFFALDQAEETLREEIAVLRGSLRLTVNGCTPDGIPVTEASGGSQGYKELYTANPAQCWLKDEFINNKSDNASFVPALPSDNPYLPADYAKTLTEAFGYRKELLEAYLFGNWSSIEGTSQVILDNWVGRCMGNRNFYEGRVISCDVARFGDDETVIHVFDGSFLIDVKKMGYSRTTDISDALNDLSRRNFDCPIVVDEVGVGGGVVDELHKMGRHVIGFSSSSKAGNPDKYYNLRAEAWWSVAELFSRYDIGCTGMYPELRNQLSVPRYDFRNGKILIESKEEIKSRLNRSPDDADCYIMGLWAVINDVANRKKFDLNSRTQKVNFDYDLLAV